MYSSGWQLACMLFQETVCHWLIFRAAHSSGRTQDGPRATSSTEVYCFSHECGNLAVMSSVVTDMCVFVCVVWERSHPRQDLSQRPRTPLPPLKTDMSPMSLIHSRLLERERDSMQGKYARYCPFVDQPENHRQPYILIMRRFGCICFIPDT